jgi:integrase
MKQEKFLVADLPTEKKLWMHLAPAIALLNQGSARPLPAAVKMVTVIDRYRKEVFPDLAKSTRDTDGSMFKMHTEPKWKDVVVSEIRPMAVDAWLKTLTREDGKPLSANSKGRARRLVKQLIDRAMFWELLPTAANPITLVKVRGSSKREKPILLLTIDQVNALVEALPPPYCLMVFITAMLGLRVEETVALKWIDFSFEEKEVNIRRAFTHGELREVKTDASAAYISARWEARTQRGREAPGSGVRFSFLDTSLKSNSLPFSQPTASNSRSLIG